MCAYKHTLYGCQLTTVVSPLSRGLTLNFKLKTILIKNAQESLPPPPPPPHQSTRDHHGDTTPTLSNSLRRNLFDAGRKPVITSTHCCATLAAQCARETTSVSGQSSSKTEDRKTQREKKQNIQDGIRRLNLCPKWSIIQCNQKTPDRFYDVTFLFSPAPLVVHCAN